MSLIPSLFRDSPAFGETFPISQTRIIVLLDLLISLDLLIKSFSGIFVDAVIWPPSKAFESLKSIIIASSAFDNAIRVWGEIFFPPLLELEYRNKIINSISKLMSLDKSQINLKGKTVEKLGLIGKQKAIACEVIISITRYE